MCGAKERRYILRHISRVGNALVLGYFLGTAVAPTAISDDGMASPSNVRMPYAPTEALLPATRVRLLIDRAVDLAERIAKEDNYEALENLLDQLDAILVSESDSPNRNVRWSFNVYTANLRFGETYTLTASKKDRSEYIRKYNGLPDVKQVITADLNLRDLYRNQILTAIDEARAELRYQKKELSRRRLSTAERQRNGNEESNNLNLVRNSPILNGDELVKLLHDAQEACRQWFSMISEDDVKSALDAVLSEQSDSIKS